MNNPELRVDNLHQVNIFNILEPLFRLPDFSKIYYGALRNVDYMSGCSLQCPVCYVDAPRLEAYFDSDSLIKALEDNRFRDLFAREIRVGILSDPFDHPQVYDLTVAFLNAVDDTLAYDTSVPVGSEDNVMKVVNRMKVNTSVKPKKNDRDSIREYAADLDKQPLAPPFNKLSLWIAYKPNNMQRINEMLGGDKEIWAVGHDVFYLLKGGYKNVGVKDYRKIRMIDAGRVLPGHNLEISSPDKDPYSFDKDSFPHTPKTIGKGKFIITPAGAFMVVNIPLTENRTGRKFISITPANYQELGMKYLIEDPNPVYIESYRPNPFFSRKTIEPLGRKAVLGFLE